MKKFSLLLIAILAVFALSACTGKEEVEVTKYTVTFDSDGGSAVVAQEVEEGKSATVPATPTKEGVVFVRWYETNSEVAFDFAQAINADVTLKALWEVKELTDADKIELDIAEYENMMIMSNYQVATPYKINLYGSKVKWQSTSDYVSDDGIILPLPDGSAETTGTIEGTFTLNDVVVKREFSFPLKATEPVVLSETRSVPFSNLTTEYEVADGDVDLFFEEGGSVPYIKVVDFFALLVGFIDPDVEITKTTTDGVLVMAYDYYDEEEDITYDLNVTIDSNENTIVTNDPGFYWAYVSTTETNYGRHIEYVQDHPDADAEEGTDVVYDLDDYHMDAVVYEGEVVLPLYVTNQLFAGLSYYNVYYNYDGLFGIYSLPDSGSKEYRTIKTSTMNLNKIPADLIVHTFNMLAFDLNNLYGLQDIMEVEDYYTILYEQIDTLLVENAEDMDEGIGELLMLSMDEAHTSYGYPSYFNKTSYTGPATNDLKYYGPRFRGWYYDGLFAVDDVIEAKWGTSDSGWNVEGRPNYWFLDDKTVMLSLNDFYTADIDESEMYDASIVADILDVTDATTLLAPIAEGNQFWYYNNSPETGAQLEILVKGVDASYEDTYRAALETAGLTHVSEVTTNVDKQAGYYTVTLDDVEYFVLVDYSVEYNLLYVGIVDSMPTEFTSVWPLVIDFDEIVNSDSAVFFEMMLDQIIAEKPAVENVILDLSWNTGGNIGALYRIVGFITDDPFRVSSIDGDTGNSGSSNYVQIDAGIPSYAHLNWSLLTTPVTFSAANEMATIFMSNDLGPIMGVQSGGGACSITPILLPNGTAFTMSSNNIGAYRTGLGTDEDPYIYHNTEFGITPDYEIDTDDIYDVTILLDILYTQEALND